MKKLISMTDFVLKQEQKELSEKIIESIFKYANFLSKKLETRMFIPCNEEGNVLEKPDFMDGSYDNNGLEEVDKYRYKQDLKKYE